MFLNQMKMRRMTPNFFCSVPYWLAAGASPILNINYVWIECDEVCLVPPITGLDKSLPVDLIWSDFYQWNPPDAENWESEFLDWEYIFDPKDFQDMSGGAWRKFRKNVKKWGERNSEWDYSRRLPAPKSQVESLLLEWLERRPETAQDAEILYYLITEPDLPVMRKYLVKKDQLVGLNVWDANFAFINFRVSITRQDEPYADEFIRWLFYTDPEVLSYGKLVNDGGVLDNPNLEWFKDKMNPMRKRPVYSWTRKPQGG